MILVGGGLDDGSENAPLAPELAVRFTVYNYARRGRGDSGDTLPYAMEREIEDIDALVAHAGGSAHVFGASSGGALVLEAAVAGVAFDKLAVYEVPYGWPPPGFVEQLEELLAADRRGDAVELFMRWAGSSEEEIAGARMSPVWPGLEALAHTLAYDAACMAGSRPPTDRLARVTQPTLVATGGLSVQRRPGMRGLPSDFFDRAADSIAASVSDAERVTVEEAGHAVEACRVAPVLGRFFER